jgi:hypothetical protein
MAATALACGGDGSKTSLFGDVSSAAQGEPANASGPCGADGGNGGPSVGSLGASSGPSAGADSGAGMGPEAGMAEAGDAGAGGDAGDAAGSIDAGLGVPVGDPNEICAPFTCELGEWSCRAALSGGLDPNVSSALYGCAQTDCVADKTWSELDAIGVACAATALAVDAAGAHVTPLCSGMVGCAAQPGELTLSRCEALYSGLTYSGASVFAARTLTCGEDERSFIRGTLAYLAYP